MPKKAKANTVAVIDIGSNELRLKIAQDSKEKLKYIESLNYPLSLGRDTFTTGKISFEKVDKTCDIIKNFLTVTEAYGVSAIRAVATTAVREAQNTDYILDQIKIKTGLSVNVIDDTEEKLFIYKLMSLLIDDDYKKSAMMIYMGSGNIGISVMDDGKIPFIQNIKMGSLRISEMFGDIQEYSSEFYTVVEEYTKSFTDFLDGEIPDNIKHFIVSGHEIAVIANLCGVKADGLILKLPKESFLKLYDDVKHKTADRISADYKIPHEKAELLLPALCIYNNLLNFTKADHILAPAVFLVDSIIYEMLYEDEFAAINKSFSKNTIMSAREHASRYVAIESHCQTVEGYALKIFDKMKKIHGLGNREKLLLQTAAILHDAGKFINMHRHYENSYMIVKNTDIVGLNQAETEIVALICLYHSRLIPNPLDTRYSGLDLPSRVLVSKLTAILRIADSLDRSHTKKFKDIDVKTVENELIITVTTDKSIDLEQWSFNEKGAFFEDVFGMKPILKKKRAEKL